MRNIQFLAHVTRNLFRIFTTKVKVFVFLYMIWVSCQSITKTHDLDSLKNKIEKWKLKHFLTNSGAEQWPSG